MKSIIELARRAGIAKHGLGYTCWEGQLERFANLIRAEVLEEAADICDRVNNYDNPMTAGDCADAIRALKEKT